MTTTYTAGQSVTCVVNGAAGTVVDVQDRYITVRWVRSPRRTFSYLSGDWRIQAA